MSLCIEKTLYILVFLKPTSPVSLCKAPLTHTWKSCSDELSLFKRTDCFSTSSSSELSLPVSNSLLVLWTSSLCPVTSVSYIIICDIIICLDFSIILYWYDIHKLNSTIYMYLYKTEKFLLLNDTHT